MTRRGWLLFAALSLFWGIPYLFIKIAVGDVNPLLVAFGRTALGGLLLLPLALRSGVLRPALARWRVVLAYTTVEIIVPWWLLSFAETRLDSSTTGLLVAMVPLVAAIMLAVLRLDHLGPRRLIGLLLGFAGVAVLVGVDVHLDDAVAVAAVVVVTLGYAAGPILISRKLGTLPPLGVVTLSLLMAATVYAPFTPFVAPRHLTAGAVGSIAVLGVVCTALAFLVMFALIAEAGPGRMTFITYVNPAVAIVLGAAVLHEPLTIGLVVGFPAILIGSVLGTGRAVTARGRSHGRRGRRTPTPPSAAAGE